MEASVMSRKKASILILCMLLLVAVTRGVSLMHNSYLHPDENVFVSASRSLKDKLMGIEEEYVEAKEYPEGAYVFRVPFHILAELYLQRTGHRISGFVSGRVAAVFYFSLGALIGCILIRRFMNPRASALTVYILTVVFSLMHLEQSRYGTGDAISMFLLMAVLLFCALGCSGRRPMAWLMLSALFCGFAGAVKYPLILFLGLPEVMLWRTGREKSIRFRVSMSLLLLLPAVLGFLVCSPKVLFDPYYVLRVIRVESRAYLSSGNIFTLGGWYNHLLSVLLYSMLYSGLPFAPCFAVCSQIHRGRMTDSASKRSADVFFLFRRLVPAVILIFIGYNITVRSLFMRTCYPFFFLTDLYAADGTAELLSDRRPWRKAGVCFLTLFMVIRGGCYVMALSERDSGERLNRLIASVGGQPKSYTLLATKPLSGPYLEYDGSLTPDAQEVYIQDGRFADPATAGLLPGELVITGTEDFSRSNRYLIPYDNERVHDLICNWESFKEVNARWYVGQAYPRFYYYLWGYWIKGTTGTDYEFPSNYVYYRDE